MSLDEVSAALMVTFEDLVRTELILKELIKLGICILRVSLIPKIWIEEAVRLEFGSRFTAKLLLPCTKGSF